MFVFRAFAYRGMIKMVIGDAMDVVPSLEGQFDIVFIDADKRNYLNYLDMCAPLVRSGGVLLSDNVLWNGKVVEPVDPKDEDTHVIMEYNRRLASDSRFETVMLPVRDGLTVSRKK